MNSNSFVERKKASKYKTEDCCKTENCCKTDLDNWKKRWQSCLYNIKILIGKKADITKKPKKYKLVGLIKKKRAKRGELYIETSKYYM